jgi:hypothetical protein
MVHSGRKSFGFGALKVKDTSKLVFLKMGLQKQISHPLDKLK